MVSRERVTPEQPNGRSAGWLRQGAARLGVDEPPALLGGLTVTAWAIWMTSQGGHGPTSWSAVGVFLVLLLALGLLVLRPELARLPMLRRVCLGAIASFVAWNYLSLIWADFPADAWTGADKTLLYAVGFSIFFLWNWPARSLATLLGVFVLAVAATSGVWLVRVLAASDPSGFFEDGRAIGPIGYVNGSVALWMMALWPAGYLAARRGLPSLLRGAFLASAALFAQLALLAQSRGWIVVLPLAVGLHLLLARKRLRTVLALAIVAAAAAATGRWLLDVFERWEAGDSLADPSRRAALAICVSCLAVGLAGAGWALLDRSVQLSTRAHRLVGACVLVAALAAVSLGSIVAVRSVDQPREWLSDRWDSFACVYCPDEESGSRFTGSLSNDRYREWTIAWHQFTESPILGAGSDNYLADYLAERRDDLFEPKYPHSTPLRLLGQLGLVGTLLLLVGAGAAIALALRSRRRSDPATGGAIGAALMVFAYWLLHGSIDFFWGLPALAAPAFGFLALAASVRVSEAAPASNPATELGSSPRSRLATVLVGLALAAAVAAVAAPGLSAAYENAGLQSWRQDSTTAYARLDTAAQLNPLSASPALFKGSIALLRGDDGLAERSFLEAIEREPGNWYGHLQLALLAGSKGDFESAERSIARARKLNPRDRVAAVADRMIRRRIAVPPQLVNGLFLKKERARFLSIGRAVTERTS